MANNLLPPDIDEITGSEEWKTFTPDQRNALVDDWALQVRNAGDWSPDELKSLDDSVDYFRENALETFGEQAKRIVKEGAVGGVKSLAALPLAVPKLGLQTGKLIGYGGDPNVSSRELTEAAPEVATMATGAEKMVQGLDTLRRQYNPFSDTDEEWEGEFDSLRKDILDRRLSEDPDQLYDYLKKKAFNIAKQNARFYGGEVEDYMPQEFQGGNDEQIFKQYFNSALEGKRPEGFIEFRDDTVPQQGLVTKNQSRSLITSPENLGLLMKFSATRNPMYFEALKQRLGRSRDRQITEARAEEIEDQRGEGDFFDDAAQTIFSAGGYFPEAGEAMKEEVRGLASSPVDIASTLFSFGLGKAAVKKAVERNLLGAAGDVAKGAGTEFVEGALSAVGDQAIPELGNIAEQGLMESVGGGVMQAAGAGVQGIQELRRPSVEGEVAEAVENPVEPIAEAPLLTPEEQEAFADADEQRAIADEAEPVAPLAAEALRELAAETENEALAPPEEVMAEEAPLTQEAVLEEAAPTQPIEDVQGTVIDQGAGGVAPIDASQTAFQVPDAQGIVPQGGPGIAGQTPVVEGEVSVQAATPPTGQSQPIPSRPAFGDPDPVGRLASQIQQAEQAEVNPESKAKLTAFSQQLPAILDRYRNLFSGVMFTRLPSGGGVNAGELTDSLRIDPQRVLDTIQTAPTTEDSVAAFEAMLDEEFRHRVSLELDRTSPDFKRDLQALWDNLTPEIKTASAELYFKQTGAQYDSDWQAKHEFFRQYWQDADFRALTETSLKEGGKYEFLQRLIDSFLKALKSLREGADANVKPILDRLIAQAQQRASEIRAQATQTQPTDATTQVQQQESLPAERESGDQGREAAQTGGSNRVLSEEGGQEEVTSLKRAVTDAERASRGAEAIPTPKSKGWSESEQEAAQQLRDNPRAGKNLLESIKVNVRPLTQTENALLLFYKVEAANDLEQAAKRVAEAQATGDQGKMDEAMAAYNDVATIYNDIDIYSRMVGTESGRSLNARKMAKKLEKKDVSLAALTQKYRTEAKNGASLTKEEISTIKKHSDELTAAMEKVESLSEEEKKANAQPVERKIALDALSEEKEAREGIKQARKKSFKDLGQSARERLKERNGKGLDAPRVGLDAPSVRDENFEDYAIVGAEYIEDGAKSLEAFTEKMTGEFGSSIQDQIEPLYNRAKEIHAEAVATLQKEQAKAKEAAKPSSVLEAGKKSLEGKPKDKIDRELAVKLFKAHVRARPSMTPEQVNSAVTENLKEIYPNITESDVRVAITDYGKAKWPSKDALKQRESEYRRILRLIESLERIQSGQQALKSGLQRSKPSPRERELTAQIKEAMKKFKVETTAENQLATTKKAITNRLKNQIEDLNRIIEGKGKPKTPREQVKYDAEMNALVKERNELQEYVDDLTGPSPEGKWNQKARAAAKASAEYYRRKIEQKDFAARSKPGYQPDETTRKLQDEAKAAKAEFENLKDLSGETQKEQLAAQKKRLESEIEKVRKRLITGEKPPAGKPKATDTEIQSLKDTLKNLRESVRLVEGTSTQSEARKAENARKQLERSIERMEKEIARREKDNKTLPTEKKEKPDSPELRALRERRDVLKETVDALKEAESPRRLPEEIALDNFKRRVERLQYEAQNMTKKQEFLNPPDDTRAKDLKERASKAKYDLEQAKKSWNNELLNKKLEARSGTRKVFDRGVETLNLSRSILTSLDLSAVLRQGGFLALANPKRLAEAFGPMLKSFVSDKARYDAMEKIKNDPDFAAAQRAKLFLSDINDADLSKMEEAFFSRWVDKIPGWAGGGLLRGSQRAYTTFLNMLRFSQFKAMKRALERNGKITLYEGKALANFINVASGRGVIGLSDKQQANPALATVFFSPRLVSSRFNLLFGQPLYGGTMRTRKLVAMEYVKFLAGVTAAMGLAALMRDPEDEEKFIEIDPRSADFLKARFGDSRLDLFGGLLQATVLLSRLVTGETKTLAGEEVSLRDSLRPLELLRELQGEPQLGDKPAMGADTLSVLGRFLRSKLSPVAGSMANMMVGEDYLGKPTTIQNEAAKMLVPMSFGSILDAMEAQGVPRGTALSILSLFGAGLQTYKPKED